MEVTRGLLLDSLKGSDNFDKCICLAKYLISEIGGTFTIEHMMSDTYVFTFRSYDIEDALAVVFRGTRCTVFSLERLSVSSLVLSPGMILVFFWSFSVSNESLSFHYGLAYNHHVSGPHG